MTTLAERHAPHLGADARQHLDDLINDLGRDPTKISTIFPAAARLVARGPSDPADTESIRTPRLEDEARVALLAAVAEVWTNTPDDSGPFVSELTELYNYGDADEKRAVLRALSALDPGPAALPIIDDALRTNDVRLVAAALGEFGARHLSADAWRQGVLKCLFVGVPLDVVAAVDDRADDELARMVADFCRERAAAGRSLPADAPRILDHFPGAAAGIDLTSAPPV